MPKFRMKATVTGSRDGVDWPRIGETIEVGKDEAAELLNSGIIEPIDDKPDVESAVLKTTSVKK